MKKTLLAMAVLASLFATSSVAAEETYQQTVRDSFVFATMEKISTLGSDPLAHFITCHVDPTGTTGYCNAQAPSTTSKSFYCYNDGTSIDCGLRSPDGDFGSVTPGRY